MYIIHILAKKDIVTSTKQFGGNSDPSDLGQSGGSFLKEESLEYYEAIQ